MKENISSLEKENSNLEFQINELKSIQNTSPSTGYTEPKTTQPTNLNYTKITKRIDGEEAKKITMLLSEFSDSLSRTQQNELAFRSVDESDFVIVVIFSGEWSLTYKE